MQTKFRGLSDFAKAHAVRPSIPAPMTRTDSWGLRFAVLTAAAMVAVAQPMGAAWLSLMVSGTLTK